MKKIERLRTGFTRISSKGQVVIPEAARSGMKLREGEVLAVAALPESDMLVLKIVRQPSFKKELPTLRAIARAWEDIERGRYKKLPAKEFLKELRRW